MPVNSICVNQLISAPLANEAGIVTVGGGGAGVIVPPVLDVSVAPLLHPAIKTANTKTGINCIFRNFIWIRAYAIVCTIR